MASGGYRPGAGRPVGTTTKKRKDGVLCLSGKTSGRTPLKYMLAVMRDVKADPARRDRMAIAAAPFCHARYGEKSKRDVIQEAIRNGGKGTAWGDLLEPPNTIRSN
jgi:hypothetical protein